MVGVTGADEELPPPLPQAFSKETTQNAMALRSKGEPSLIVLARDDLVARMHSLALRFTVGFLISSHKKIEHGMADPHPAVT
jgi:hypothetical protein